MNNFRFYENELGFSIDYIFNDNNFNKCLRLSEDDDYFSFSIFSENIDLMNSISVNINNENPLFVPLYKLLENNTFIDILEEGSDEGKSLSFAKSNDNIIILTFGLTKIPTSASSISITNVRLASPNVTFTEKSDKIDDFKNKLHLAFYEMKDNLKTYTR